MRRLKDEYGDKKGESVFYALSKKMKNKKKKKKNKSVMEELRG